MPRSRSRIDGCIFTIAEYQFDVSFGGAQDKHHVGV